MATEPQWIDSEAELADVLGQIGAGPIAIDTEADSLHHYPEKVCLIQLSFMGQDYLIDPLTELPLDPLLGVLADRSVLTVLHGADYDLRMLDRGYDARIHNLFDTMVAARFCNVDRFGLGHLLDGRFGVQVDKKFQRADWSLRPLSAEMIRYASMDTRYLLDLREQLVDELNSLGRMEWAQEEFERLEEVRASPAPDPAEGYKKVKGSTKLDPPELAVLQQLWLVRERAAVESDRPPFRIMHDERLIDLATNPPTTDQHLARVHRLPRSWQRGRRAQQLLDAIKRGVSTPAEQLPSRPARPQRRAPWKNDPRVLRLRDLRDEVARDIELDPGLVAPRSVLEQIVERLEAGQDPSEAKDLRRWQWQLLAPVIEKLDLSAE
jgi:ribonuclease D